MFYSKSFGNLTFSNELFNVPVTDDTIYDMASLTKVVSTTSAVMRLYEEGLMGLDDKIIKWIPEADNNGKGDITVRNLLLHNAGLAPDYPFAPDGYTFWGVTKKDILDWLYTCELDYEIGTQFIYSDLSMVFLQ